VLDFELNLFEVQLFLLSLKPLVFQLVLDFVELKDEFTRLPHTFSA
jgi:hypothetical protein